MKKVITLLISLCIILIGITQKDTLLLIVEKGNFFSVLVSVTLVYICVFFPIVPFAILTSLIGIIFGVIEGISISISGVMIGTVLMFSLARFGYKDYAQKKLNKFPKVEELETRLHTHSFVFILFARLIQFIPSPAINILCGLSNVRFYVFFIASLIGKLPNVILLTVAGANLTSNKWLSMILYSGYFTLIFIIAVVIIVRNKSSLHIEH